MIENNLKHCAHSLLRLLIFMIAGFGVLCPQGALAADNQAQNILQKFRNLEVDAKPMARMWFPDAGAGADDNDLIGLQIRKMAEGGFGGVELALLADETTYTLEQAREVGWGTENWKNVLKKTLRAANAVEGGFKVDITITAHWPPVVSTIDPNDPEASQELSYAYEKIKASDFASRPVDVPLPTQKTTDGKRHPFYFTDTLVDAHLVKVSDVDSDGAPVLDFDSIIRVTDSVTPYGGLATGIPDDLQSEAGFGKRPSGSDFSGKFDSRGLRKRMADWQDFYRIDLKSMAQTLGKLNDDDDISAGDWLLFGTYRRGTGQVLSGGGVITMYPGHYVTDYFSREGIQKVLDFWNERLLSDPELLTLLKENGGKVGASIFEDSIEASHSGPFWTYDFLDELEEDYADADRISLVVALSSGREGMGGMPPFAMGMSRGENAGPPGMGDAGRGAGMEFPGASQGGMPDGAPQGGMPDGAPQGGMPDGTGGPAMGDAGRGGGMPEFAGPGGPGMGSEAESAPKPVFGDSDAAERIVQDYNLKLGELYEKEHAAVISGWAAGFNYTYRAQGYSLTGLDIAGAAAALDVPEGDNATSGDGLRNLSSAVNLYDKKFLSMEAITTTKNAAPWQVILKVLNGNFSHGVNRVILHGSPYAKTFDNNHTTWPGWDWGGGSVGVEQFTAWNQRQIYWEDVNIFSDYVARNQTLLQNGTAKVDLAVLNDTASSFSIKRGNSMQTLLDRGFSYNILSEAMLASENAVVSGGRLYADGPAYRALILNNATVLSTGAVQKILEFADSGLPVVIYQEAPSTVYGTETADNNDADLQRLVAQLEGRRQVAVASDQEGILAALAGFGVRASAQHDAPGLEVSRLFDRSDGTDYYYLFNNGKGDLSTTASFEGDGVPYIMDAWTGEAIPVARYTANGGSIAIPVALSGEESKILAICATPSQSGFPTPEDRHVVSVSGGSVLYKKGRMVFQSNDAGSHAIGFSDGSQQTVAVEKSMGAVDLSGGWDLTLYSFGPDDSPENLDERKELIDPTRSRRTELVYRNISLVPWNALPAADAQLSQLSTIFKTVTGMKDVSGIGYYTRSFTLPADWEKQHGAVLYFGHGEDMVTKVSVNGQVMDRIDQLGDRLDIGDCLEAGENTIEIKLDTTVKNRVSLEIGPPTRANPENTGNTDNGLTSVRLVPYTETAL